MNNPAVEFTNICMRFGEVTALESVNLSIGDGTYMVFLGPSGGGKTTLLNILGGFLKPTQGTVRIFGSDVTGLPAARRPTATVFQDYALFPHMNVAANVGFGLKMRKVPVADRRDKVAKMLDLVGLAHAADLKVHQLSGGQRQRIALARALVVEPRVLLLDEPLGALDMKLRRQMQGELKLIQKRVGTTFVHVTHDQEEAMAIGDTIVVMNHGSIEDTGSPERIYLRPATRFAASFMGESNILEGQISVSEDGVATVETALASFPIRTTAIGGRIVLSIRPEHLYDIGGDGRIELCEGQVVGCDFLGTHRQCTVHISAQAQTLKIRLPPSREVKPGDEMSLYVDPDDVVPLKS
jgi:spermidine/putrescine transport system ATP-binding protein